MSGESARGDIYQLPEPESEVLDAGAFRPCCHSGIDIFGQLLEGFGSEYCSRFHGPGGSEGNTFHKETARFPVYPYHGTGVLYLASFVAEIPVKREHCLLR